ARGAGDRPRRWPAGRGRVRPRAPARARSDSGRTGRGASLMGAAGKTLAGRRIVVSAGPTFEDIDPVRFIGNRSSGKMGFAIAAAAARRGADVVLVAGPVALATPDGVRRLDVRSAAQMHDA